MRDILQNFPTELVDIYNENGTKVTKVKGFFGKTGLTITETTIPILEGQVVYRTLPNGYIEKYEIINSKYVKGIGDGCDFYKISLIKSNCKSHFQKGNVYNNISINIGDNNRIEKSIIGNDNKGD